MAIIKVLVPVLLLAGLLSTTGASQAPDASCAENDSESSGLLQVSQLAAAGKGTAAIGCASGECCAPAGRDPYDPELDADGKCCEDLYKVKNKWFGSKTCNYQCLACSKAGEDVYRYCGSGCGGCHAGGDELVPCCPGLTQKLVKGRYICV